MKLVMLFLEYYALESLCKFNAALQSSLPMLPSLKAEVKRMLRIFWGRFIKADAIKAADDDLNKVNIDDAAVQLPDSQLGISHKTWAYLSDKEDYLDRNVKRIFFWWCQRFLQMCYFNHHEEIFIQ